MRNMKKILSAAVAALLVLQSMPAVFAGMEPDTDNAVMVYSTDFSDKEPGEAVDGKQLYIPSGWSFERSLTNYPTKVYADIESDGKMPGSPYLRIYNDGSQNSSQVMTATKELSLPDGPGLVHAGFKYSTAHGNYAATAGLTDAGNKGISICSAWSGSWISDTVTVDGEPQTPYGSSQWRIFVSDLLGTGSSGKWAIGDGRSFDDGTWRSIEFVANTSSERVETEIAGKSISLGGGNYAVSLSTGGSTNILKGVLPSGMGAFSKFYVSTPSWFQGNEVRIDDVSVEFTPMVYIENRFTNKATVKCGGTEVTSADGIGSEISVENTLMNKALRDRSAAVLAAVYRNGYMISTAADFTDAVPHSATGDEDVYSQLDLTLTTPAEDIFGDMSLSVFTLDDFGKIGARCAALNIPASADSTEFTGETVTPEIDKATNLLTYGGGTANGSTVTYAVLKNGSELSADMTADAFCKALYYFGETAANADGEYAFKVKFAGTNADYTLVVNDGNEIKSYPLTFENKLADSIAGELGSVTDTAELKQKLDAFLEAVQFSNSAYNANISEIKSGDLFYNIFLDEIKKNPVKNGDDVLKNAQLAALIFALDKESSASGFLQTLMNNIDLLDMNRVYSNELFADKVLTDESVKASIYANFAERACGNGGILSGIEEFLGGIGDSIVLTICENTVGAAAGKRVIEHLNTHIGKTDSDFAAVYKSYSGLGETARDSAAAAIMNRKHDSISSLIAVLSDAAANAGSNGGETVVVRPGGGGGGGSKGGSSGGGGGTSFTAPKTEQPNDLTPPSYTVPEKGEESSFTDLTDAVWAEEYVKKLSERGIVSGDENGNFYPNSPILREEFVKMLVKTLGIDTLYVGSAFSDVPNDAWYYEYVSAAYANGIVTGTDSGTFGAGERITREDMCTMLYRALKKYGVYMADKENAPFSDDASLSQYARDGVYALKSLGAIGGFPDGSFEPGRSASRAETAKILTLVLEYMENEQNNTANTEESGK